MHMDLTANYGGGRSGRHFIHAAPSSPTSLSHHYPLVISPGAGQLSNPLVWDSHQIPNAAIHVPSLHKRSMLPMPFTPYPCTHCWLCFCIHFGTPY